MFEKIMITSASIISIAFGLWHFFVPKIYSWYSYIDVKATELVLAVRAINVFFSLSLVLFGLANIILIFSSRVDKFSIMLVLALSSVLWLVRVIMQLIYPQGSVNPILQHGMLVVFVLTFALYLASLVLVKLW